VPVVSLPTATAFSPAIPVDELLVAPNVVVLVATTATLTIAAGTSPCVIDNSLRKRHFRILLV